MSCENCPLRDICNITDIKQYLVNAMPPTVFKLFKEEGVFDTVRLSNRISESLISLLKLKIASFKDLIFSKTKFPLEVFPAIEFITHLAHAGFLKWGYWVRNLAAADFVCQDYQNKTISAFKSIVERISQSLPALIQKGELLEEIINDIKEKKVKELEEKIDGKEPDFYSDLNHFFEKLYDFCDICIYIVVSFSLINNSESEKDKIIYVAPSLLEVLDEYLQFFLQKLPEKGLKAFEVCITTPVIKNEVAFFVRKYDNNIEVTLC